MMDWRKTVEDILQAGWTERVLAPRIGCTTWQIAQLRCGEVEEPKYSIGDFLTRLHAAAKRAGLLEPLPVVVMARGRPPGGNFETHDAHEVVDELISLGLSAAAIARRIGVAPETFGYWRSRQRLTSAAYVPRLEELRDRCERAGLFDILCPPRDPNIGRVLSAAFSRRK